MRIFIAEWIMMRRRSFVLGWLGPIIFFAILATFMTFQMTENVTGQTRGPFGEFPGIERLQQSSGLVAGLDAASTFIGIISLSLFAVTMARQFEAGTIRHFLVAEPRRRMLLSGRLVALASFVAIGVLLATLVSIATSFLAAPRFDVATEAWLSVDGLIAAASAFGNTAIAAMIWGILGGTLAVVTRSAATTIAGGVGAFLILENLLGETFMSSADRFPGSILSSLAAGGTQDTTYVTALVMALIYGAIGIILTLLVFGRRDVTD